MVEFKEEWRTIDGYPDYSVSDLGRVKKNRLMKRTVNSNGYAVLGLTNDEGRKNFNVHRLVYEAFVRKLEKHERVRHINGNKLNNKIGNLRLTNSSRIGENELNFIRSNARKLGGTMTNAELAKIYDVSTVAIFKIVNGQSRVGG